MDRRAKMPKSQRAKQFAPFDAVVGLRTALKEKEKICISRKEVSEDLAAEIDSVLKVLETGDNITIMYYDNPEENYIRITGKLKNINTQKQTLQISDDIICIDDICFIEKN